MTVVNPSTNPVTPENIGHPHSKISVELSTRFLEHFSEQLYSSPQKAFEELISNGWDAGASHVDVRIATNLSDPNATMTVFDNGSSMDEEGLRQLWHIAFSPKTNEPVKNGRHVIGKFGIGKLATYVLATRLTYICKAEDGVIRRVTMDYGVIDQQAGSSQDSLISNLQLDLYEVSEEEVEQALANVYDGAATLKLIKKISTPPALESDEDDFGASKTELIDPPKDTWTIVILAGLKPAGKSLKIGVLSRMLEAALPFGSDMAITINDKLLASSKISAPIMSEWTIGPELGITDIEISDGDATDSDGSAIASSQAPKKIQLTSGSSPRPYVDIPGVGKVTGKIWLFQDRISGGKSDERGSSNGFHVNVLGRIVNQNDPSFGEDNLSHAAWARFRMAVRADGLNELLTTDREKFKEGPELKVFRAFLRRAFNKARTIYDSDKNSEMPNGGDVLVKSLGVLSLNPLRNVVSETLDTGAPISGLFDESGISDRTAKRKSWQDDTAENIKNALGQVKYEHVADDSFVKFRISDNSIVINKDHPFVVEHSGSKAEKELLRTMAMVGLLADVYALDIGVAPSALESIRNYRDQLFRFRALQRRQSGTYIAKLLLQMQHDSANSKRLEAVLSDALRYLGFQVEDLATSGEPEGIASAYTTPTFSTPTKDKPKPPLFSFSFDAKSSKHESASTGNIKLDGVVEHRDRHKADYALIVAPGYEEGALSVRCEQQKVTPMTAKDLGTLLEYTVEFGAIPVTKMREVFAIHDPKKVSIWVEELGSWLKDKRPLTIDIFLKALSHLKGKVPDALPAGMIALICRENLGAYAVKDEDVLAIANGLAILVPDLVGVVVDKIIVNASAERVAAAIEGQLQRLHDAEPVVNGGVA